MFERNLQSTIDFYGSLYNKEIIDKGLKFNKENNMMSDTDIGEFIKTIPILEKDKTSEEIGKMFNEFFLSRYLSSYLHGALDNIGLTTQEIFSEIKEEISEYRKNKDFCVFYYFGDNDFGSHFLEGAQLFVKQYNKILDNIDYYVNYHKVETDNIYIKDIEKIEDIENIRKIISYGFISFTFQMYGDFITSIHTKELFNINEINDQINHYFTYLKFNDSNNFKVGKYKDVEEIVKNNKQWFWKEGDDLKNMWFNGEALIMFMENNVLKCSIL